MYVDTSTLIKLIIDEEGSDRAELIWMSADLVASVSLVVVEARAALAAAARSKRLSTNQLRVAKTELAAFVNDLHLVEVTEELIESAAQLAETESLRDYDAVHLASAVFVGAEVLTSADRTLIDAAERQGLHTADPLMASGMSRDGATPEVVDDPRTCQR